MPAGMSQVAIAISTISANRMVYADGSVNRVAAARRRSCLVVGSAMGVSCRVRPACVAVVGVVLPAARSAWGTLKPMKP